MPKIQRKKVQTEQWQKLDTQITDFGFLVKKILSISNRQKVKFSYDIGKKSA